VSFSGYGAMGKNRFLALRALLFVLLCVLCLDSTQTFVEQTNQNAGQGLIDMSIEELMEIPVICNSDNILHPVTEAIVCEIERA